MLASFVDFCQVIRMRLVCSQVFSITESMRDRDHTRISDMTNKVPNWWGRLCNSILIAFALKIPSVGLLW